MLSNLNKINYRNVENEDVHVVNMDGAEIVIVCVKEAPERQGYGGPLFIQQRHQAVCIRRKYIMCLLARAGETYKIHK